jgi:hypothetical protein
MTNVKNTLKIIARPISGRKFCFQSFFQIFNLLLRRTDDGQSDKSIVGQKDSWTEGQSNRITLGQKDTRTEEHSDRITLGQNYTRTELHLDRRTLGQKDTRTVVLQKILR